MKYLVDANVLSEPTKPSPDPRVVDWLRAHEPAIAVDPVILGELRFGILILSCGKEADGAGTLVRCSGRASPLSSLGSGHRPEMGGTAGASSQNRKNHADQG